MGLPLTFNSDFAIVGTILVLLPAGFLHMDDWYRSTAEKFVLEQSPFPHREISTRVINAEGDSIFGAVNATGEALRLCQRWFTRNLARLRSAGALVSDDLRWVIYMPTFLAFALVAIDVTAINLPTAGGYIALTQGFSSNWLGSPHLLSSLIFVIAALAWRRKRIALPNVISETISGIFVGMLYSILAVAHSSLTGIGVGYLPWVRLEISKRPFNVRSSSTRMGHDLFTVKQGIFSNPHSDVIASEELMTLALSEVDLTLSGLPEAPKPIE